MSPTPRVLLAPLAGLALLVCSCAIDTPQTRIANNPGAFEALSTRHQGLVERGLIERGMPKQGVLLALGTPSGQAEGFRDGAAFERWDYTSLQPIYSQQFYSTFGYGGYGRYGYRGYGFGVAPSVDYVPMRSASVWFRRNKVDSWERLAP